MTKTLPRHPSRKRPDEAEQGVTTYETGQEIDIRDAAELYQRHSPELFGFLIGLLRHRVQAEDVLQETFIKVLGAEDQLAELEDPRAWLFTIARRAAIDYGRKEGRHEGSEDLASLLDSSAVLAAALPVRNWTGLEDEERTRIVQEALAELEVEARGMLLLYAHGFSFRAIGSAVGCSHPTAKKRFARAAAAFTRILIRGRIFDGGDL